jgi:hypothetical protein
MKMFKQYWVEVLSGWWGIVWLLAGAISTSATFIPIYSPKFAVPHWVPGAISVVAWLMAPYRLYKKNQTQIHVLTADAQRRSRRAKLVLIDEKGSFYIRCSEGQGTNQQQESGFYLELWVSIENKGERPATITNYSLRVDGVGEFSDISPSPRNYILGLRAQHNLGDSRQVVGRYIEVQAERLASQQRIPFMISTSAPRGVREIKCELAVRDTEGNSDMVMLTVAERGND